MHPTSTQQSNIEFIHSLERTRRWPRRLAACLIALCGVMLCMLPEAFAKPTISASDKAEIMVEMAAQIEAALPYEGARHNPLKKLKLRGKLPHMWRLELISPSSWRTTRVQAKIFDIERPERPAAFVQAEIDIEVPIYQALSTIEAGQALHADLFEQVYTSIYHAPHDALTQLDAVQDKIAKRKLVAGKVVVEGLLDDPVIYERGAQVKIKVQRGSVELVDTGVTLEKGKLNQMVRVKSSSTDATLTGLVRRDGVVF